MFSRNRRPGFAELVALLLAATIAGPFRQAPIRAATQVHSTDERGALSLGQAIRRLGVVASVLHTGAHPDDEDLRDDFIEFLSRTGDIAAAVKAAQELVVATNDPYRRVLRRARLGDLYVAGRNQEKEALAAYAAALGDTGAGSWLEKDLLRQIEMLHRRGDRLDELAAFLRSLSEKEPQRLAVRRAAHDAPRSAKQRVGSLLEPEQHAALVVADQRGEFREAQPVCAVPPRELPHEPVDLQEVAQDLEDPRGAAHGSPLYGNRRGKRAAHGSVRTVSLPFRTGFEHDPLHARTP